MHTKPTSNGVSTAETKIQETESHARETSGKAKSISDACRAYGVGRTFIYQQIRIGALTARKAGRRTLVATDELERWFAALPRVNKSNRAGQ